MQNIFNNKLMNKKIFILCIIMFLSISLVQADTINRNLVNIYFFHSDTCSHCKSEINVLDSLEKKYDNIRIYRYEIHEENNNEIRKKVQELYDVKTNGVPLTIIGDMPYSGFKDETSKIVFTKTIEYYSRYSYVDRVGQLLQNEDDSSINPDENIPTLEEFMATYGNYQLIGEIQTDDLDISTNAILLGSLSQLNIIRVITIFIILIFLSRIENQKDKLMLLMHYLVISFLCTTIYIISNKIYIYTISILILILFILGLLKYNKNKKSQYIYGNVILIFAITSNYLEYQWCSNYLSIWKNLMVLYDLAGFEQVVYYLNYILTIIMINVLIVLISYGIKKLIQKITKQTIKHYRG